MMTLNPLADAGLRYYVEIPFARTLDADEQDGLEDALAGSVVDHGRWSFKNPHQVDPDRVTMTEAYAIVEFSLSAGGDESGASVKKACEGAVSKWVHETGPHTEPTRLGGETQIGTLPAPPLQVEDELEPIKERAQAKHEGESVDTEAASQYYLIALPERPLTDDEVTRLGHAIGDDGAVTSEYVALFDVPLPGSGTPGADRRFFQTLRDDPENDPSADIVDRYLWQHREAGSVGGDMDAEATREAVRARAEAFDEAAYQEVSRRC